MTDLQLSRCSVEAARHCSEKDQHFQHLETSFCQSGEYTTLFYTCSEFQIFNPHQINYPELLLSAHPYDMYFRDFGNSADKQLLLG